MHLFFSILSTVALFERVSAHGYVNQVAVDGKWYAGNKPGSSSQGPSPIRLISDGGPLQLQNSKDVDFVCGKDASKAQLTVPVNTSSLVAFNWVGMDGTSAWIHKAGPLLTYMASCGSESCNAFEPTVETRWFKVAQLGQLPNDTSHWFQEAISTERKSYVFQLPDNLAPGGYLIRHEMLSLQNAVAPNGIEFYPMCLQVNVAGEGQSQPDDTITLPAVYHASTDGLVFDTYTPPVPAYPFPGGPLSSTPASGQGLGPAAPSLPDASSPSQDGSAPAAPPSATPEEPNTSAGSYDGCSSQPPRCLTKRNTGLRHRAAHSSLNAGLRRAW